MDGYILIHRKLLEWEWYSSINDTRLFIHCLLKANWKDGRFRGYEVPRGSFITSVSNLAEETGLTIQQVKTSINHLKITNEITIETNHQFSIITIKKYNDYQLEQQTKQKTINKRLTNEQQTSNNNRININKEIKEINKKESISKDIPKKEVKYFESLKVNTIFNEFIEVRKKLKAVNSERAINLLINKLNNYDEETQYKMIEQSIINSWKGIFELKEKKERKDNVFETLERIYYE